MSFGAPSFLWLLLFLPVAGLLAVWARRRAPGHTLEYSDLSWLPPQRSVRLTLARWLPTAARLVAAGCFLFALAQPQWPEAASRVLVPARAFMLVLDVSGSMAEADFPSAAGPQRRLDAAKGTLRDLILARPQDQLGLVTFAAQPEAVCPPTLSHPPLLSLLEHAQPEGTVPDNTTNLGDALAVALERIRQAAPREKVILLCSDGEHNLAADAVGPTLKPGQAAQLARALGVRIHTLFLEGAVRDEPSHARQAEASQQLREAAAATGGQFFRVGDAAGLAALQATLDKLEPTPVPSFEFQRQIDLYPAFVAAGLLVLLFSWFLEETALRLLPGRAA